MRIAFLKALDSLAGRFAIYLLPAPKAVTFHHQIRTLLLIRPGGVGDAVLLIPAINTLKTTFPNLSIHMLAEKRNSEVFSLCKSLQKVYRYDVPGELFSVLHGKYDVVIDTEQWHRLSAVIDRLTGE